MACLVRAEEMFPLLRNENKQLPYLLVANWDIFREIHKYEQESISTLRRHMMNIYINDTLIPKMLEGMQNGTTNYKLIETYGLTMICHQIVGEFLTNLGFRYDYGVKN